MESLNELKEWRSEEIAKIFLLKSKYVLSVEQFPTGLYDFFVRSTIDENVSFAVEVKRKALFAPRMKEQLKAIKIYQQNNMINLPVILFRIDEVKETGELDFLVAPGEDGGSLVVKEEWTFVKLTEINFAAKLNEISAWNKLQRP